MHVGLVIHLARTYEHRVSIKNVLSQNIFCVHQSDYGNMIVFFIKMYPTFSTINLETL